MSAPAGLGESPESEHTPVLLSQVLAGLQASNGGRFIDCTANGGGHAEAILSLSTPGGRLLGLDVDPQALARCKARLRAFGNRLDLLQRNFSQLRAAVERIGFGQAHGVLFDLGMSSLQLANPRRGFSWQREGPLDMRMDPAQPLTAATIVNTWDQEDLANLIWEYGEERHARRIARRIVERRRKQPLATVTELADIARAAYGQRDRKPRQSRRIHPATRTFQALRIAVNRELDHLHTALEQARDLLVRGGRLVVIAFHSLEDRIVKGFMRHAAGRCVCPAGVPDCVCNPCETLRVLTKKPIRPDDLEVARNPRSRSARLRIAERI